MTDWAGTGTASSASGTDYIGEIIEAIMTKATSTDLWADVGGRIYFETAPQNTELPYVVFEIVSDVPEYPGGKTIEDIIIQFSIFSESDGSAEITGILGNLRALFDDCSLSITGSTLIYFIRGQLTTGVSMITEKSGEPILRHYAQDYSIMTVNT